MLIYTPPHLPQQDLLIRPINGDVLLILKTILPPHQLKHNQPGARTGHLSHGRNPEVLVQILAPSAGALGQGLALVEGFLVRMVVAAHDLARALLLLGGLEVECFEAAEVDVLDFGEGVLDGLGGDAGANAGEEEKGGLEGEVRFDYRAGVRGGVGAEGPCVEEAVARARAVVPGDEVVVALGLYCFEGAEEDGGAQGVFTEAERPAGEDALQSDGAQLVAGVVPHGFVLAVEDVGGAEAGL